MAKQGCITGSALFAVSLLCITTALATSEVITQPTSSKPASSILIKGPYSFYDLRSPNTIGYGYGEGVTYGALSVLPSGDADGDGFADSDGVSPPTIGTATQSCVSGRRLRFNPLPNYPNQFGRFSNFSRSGCRLMGPWTLTFANGITSTSVITQPISNSLLGNYVETVWLTAGGTTPTFTWNFPLDSKHTRLSLRVFDLQSRLPGRIARTIFSKVVPKDTTSFTVPDGILSPNHHYVFAVQLDEYRNDRRVARARSFFNFATASRQSEDTPLYLPIARIQRKTGQGTSWFTLDVEPGRTVYVSPLVATDYAFRSDDNGPHFAAVVLPSGAGNQYHVTFEGSLNKGVAIPEGGTFAFPKGGVATFTLTRVELGEHTATDKLAFPVGLRFASSGLFRGTVMSTAPALAMLKGFGRGCGSRLLSKSGDKRTLRVASSQQACPTGVKSEKALPKRARELLRQAK